MEHTQPIASHTARDTAVVVVISIILGSVVTYLEVTPVFAHVKSRVASLVPHAQPRATVQPAATKPPPTVVQPAAPPSTAPAATVPATTPKAATAVTNSFVHLRSGKGTNFPIIRDLDAGTQVQLRSDSNAVWQGVTFNGQDGYIYRQYLTY